MDPITAAKKMVPKPVKKYLKDSGIYYKAVRFNSRIATFLLGSPIDLHVDFCVYLTSKERLFLYNKAKEVINGVIVEIGTYNGGSTYFLAMGADASGSGNHVYAIDPFTDFWERQLEEDDKTGCVHKDKPSMENVRQAMERYGIDNVELIKGFSTDVAKDWEMPVDFLWIDGNHRRVREDYDAWKGFLRSGSMIAFHDANHPDAGYDFVTEAVDEIMEEDPWTDIERAGSIRFARRPVRL